MAVSIIRPNPANMMSIASPCANPVARIILGATAILLLHGCNVASTSGSKDENGMSEPTANASQPAETQLVAIDVLLVPDATMINAANKWNSRLREQMPAGFSLDASHRPHVTLLQQYIAEKDVDAVIAAVEALAASTDLDAMKLSANGLYHIPSDQIGLQGITIKPSPAIAALQSKVIASLATYRKHGGDQTAFVPDPTGAAFDPLLFTYVDTFAESQSGSKFNPHVTTGTAPLAWVEAREKEPFQTFDFGVDRLTVYRLGNFGTAARPLAD